MQYRRDLCFVHEVTGQQIELHWRLFLNPHLVDGPMAVASQVVRLSDTANLRTLSEEDLFCYLCMHGALHWWNQLKWVADIGALLATAPDNAERFNNSAKVKGAGRAAAQAMLLCKQLLDTPLPTLCQGTLRKSTGELAQGNRTEGYDRWLRRAGTGASALSNNPGELIGLSSPPRLALPNGRVAKSFFQ